MGAVGARIGELIEGLRDTPWPDAERVVAWANGAGDDLDAAWATCPRGDDLLAVGFANGRSPVSASWFVAMKLRQALRQIKKRDPRITRAAFAAEEGARKDERTRLLDDARHLLADAERTGARLAKAEPTAETLTRRASMEVERAAAFVALSVVSDYANRYANLAHALRQIASAFAALRLAESGGGDLDAATGEELVRLAPELRTALSTSLAGRA